MPVPDQKLLDRYGPFGPRAGAGAPAAAVSAKRHFWLAVRRDLLRPGVQDALSEARAQMRHRDEVAALLADASDVRLFDILAWG